MSVKYRGSKHMLLLYPDNPIHLKILDDIKTLYDYCCILHDKDCDKETGEVKKAHYHVIISTRNATWNTALAKDLSLEINLIQKVRNEEAALEYLIHMNEEEKHQYDIEEVTGPFKRKLLKYINMVDLTESDKVLEIIQQINDYNIISVTELSYYCANAQYWDVFRRSAIIFIKIMEEKRAKSLDNK